MVVVEDNGWKAGDGRRAVLTAQLWNDALAELDALGVGTADREAVALLAIVKADETDASEPAEVLRVLEPELQTSWLNLQGAAVAASAELAESSRCSDDCYSHGHEAYVPKTDCPECVLGFMRYQHRRLSDALAVADRLPAALVARVIRSALVAS